MNTMKAASAGQGTTRVVRVVAMAVVLAGPAAVFAQQQNTLEEFLTKQNIGRAVGGVVGGLLGSQVGSGKGQLAATAAGALAGFWLGGKAGEQLEAREQQAIAYSTNTALETGQPQSWHNPDTGVSTRVAVQDSRVEQQPVHTAGLQRRLSQTPPLEMVNAFHVAVTDSNVRGGPGTGYDVMRVLRTGERVAVVGKVMDQDWYMISDDGFGSGFVHTSLLRRDGVQPDDGSALRQVMSERNPAQQVVAERTCSLVTQEVTLRDGSTQTHTMTACRQPDGTWVEA